MNKSDAIKPNKISIFFEYLSLVTKKLESFSALKL